MLTHIPTGLAGIVATFGDLATPNFEARYIEPFLLPYPLKYGELTVTRARGHYLRGPVARPTADPSTAQPCGLLRSG